MAKAVIKANRLNYNNKKYFRTGSEDIVIGSYGEKRTPIFGGNYLETQDIINSPKLKVKQAVIADIDFEQSREGDVEESLAGTFKGVDVELSAGQVWQKLRSGEVKLVKLIVELNDMEDAINADAGALDDLRDYGNKARVAYQVFVVMSATMAETFSRSQRFGVAVSRGQVKVTAKGTTGQSGDTTVTLSKGSTFAYMLASLDWNARTKKKKTRVVDLDDDQWSVN